MLKHPAQSFHKFSQRNFLQENIGLLNSKTLQNYEKKTSKPYFSFKTGNKKTSVNHETSSDHRFFKRSAS